MTPLEEIEQAIAYHSEESDEYKRIEILAPLYQARAIIERLEASARAIGVIFQAYAAETLPLMRKLADIARPAPPDWDAPHPFKPGLRDECQCMRPRADPLHSVPIPRHPIHLPDVCIDCGMEVGRQHRPSCGRRGIVSKDSVSRV